MINILKNPNLIYKIDAQNHSIEKLTEVLNNHKEIKFVSLLGVDLRGNATDEKIPIKILLEDIEKFLESGVQTDGSSVELRNIATLDDARVTLIPDVHSTWIIDYNLMTKDYDMQYPVGTLVIPSFLVHSNEYVCSRSILKKSEENLKKYILESIKKNDNFIKETGINREKIKEIFLTSATELEFWVKTPQERTNEEELNTSQGLKEQYWKRAEGNIRTAMEYILILMDKYGFEPEMAHKEAGGVRSQLNENGSYCHIMEQLEIDWKYSDPLTTSDSFLFIKNIILDVFNYFGLEVTFAAKPVENSSGSGAHMHIGICAKLEDGTMVNLFNHKDYEENYLNSIGYSSLAGILNNYEVINPFITATTDGFNRLKPGYEAPVCVVCSLGSSAENLSRNRSVLVGLVKDFKNHMQTRFELRSPNPNTNIYLGFASVYQAMIDGMDFYLNKYDMNEILEDISKSKDMISDYFEHGREYRAEADVFDNFTQAERNNLFSKPPATVYENIEVFLNKHHKIKVLTNNDIFTNKVIESYSSSVLHFWALELKSRIIENYRDEIREMKKIHNEENTSEVEIENWSKICDMKQEIMKDTMQSKSLFSTIINEIDNENYSKASNLQIILSEKMRELKSLYSKYSKNII